MRRLLTAAALALTLAATGSACSSDDNDTETLGSEPTASAAASTVDLSKKPEIEVPDGPPPSQLQISDLAVGTGAVAVAGQEITVKYVGVTYADGKEFDASWGGQDFVFPLGGGRVIQGWDEGFAGMKEGGRRQLIIPPALGYGASGAGPIPPNATLIFVVDLVKVG